jgi:hypothetical protein
MLRLSDAELDQVYAACRPLAPDRRDGFLQALAAELRDKPIGPGSVHRAIVVVQRAYFDAPLETEPVNGRRLRRMGIGKYA